MFPFTALIYGTLAAGAAFLLESLFLTGFSFGLIAFTAGALIEEGMKLLFLFQYQKRFPPSIPSSIPFQLFSFSLFGIGFALIEIFLALPPDIGILFALVGIHTFTSLLLGYVLLSRERSSAFLPVGIISAVCAHTAYNLFIASLQ
jgi:hypothetical protein